MSLAGLLPSTQDKINIQNSYHPHTSVKVFGFTFSSGLVSSAPSSELFSFVFPSDVTNPNTMVLQESETQGFLRDNETNPNTMAATPL